MAKKTPIILRAQRSSVNRAAIRSEAEMDRARGAVKFAGAGAAELTAAADGIAIGPMHLAKGLEFPAVAELLSDFQ